MMASQSRDEVHAKPALANWATEKIPVSPADDGNRLVMMGSGCYPRNRNIRRLGRMRRLPLRSKRRGYESNRCLMDAKNRKMDGDSSAELPYVVTCGRRSLLTAGRDRAQWLAARLVRFAAFSAILLGLIGSRASVHEIVSGEVVETVEVVVSFNLRHHESETFSASDRDCCRRKCAGCRGRSKHVVRRCCRHLSREIRDGYVSGGHRLPDNSLAPLLI